MFLKNKCFLIIILLCVVFFCGCSEQKEEKEALPGLEYVPAWSAEGKSCVIYSSGQEIGTLLKHFSPENMRKGADAQITQFMAILQSLGVYDFEDPTLPYTISSSTFSDWQLTFGERGDEKTYYYFLLEDYVYEFRFSKIDGSYYEMNENLATFILSLVGC